AEEEDTRDERTEEPDDASEEGAGHPTSLRVGLRHNDGVTTGGSHPRGRSLAWVLGTVVVVLGALPPVLRYLVHWPQDQWQVDVEVYRRAGVSVLTGADVYAVLTDPPQLLPFTYPPFAAILA